MQCQSLEFRAFRNYSMFNLPLCSYKSVVLWCWLLSTTQMVVSSAVSKQRCPLASGGPDCGGPGGPEDGGPGGPRAGGPGGPEEETPGGPQDGRPGGLDDDGPAGGPEDGGPADVPDAGAATEVIGSSRGLSSELRKVGAMLVWFGRVCAMAGERATGREKKRKIKRRGAHDKMLGVRKLSQYLYLLSAYQLSVCKSF